MQSIDKVFFSTISTIPFHSERIAAAFFSIAPFFPFSFLFFFLAIRISYGCAALVRYELIDWTGRQLHTRRSSVLVF